MRWSVSIVAEGDRIVSHDEIVELADAVATSDGIASGIGTSRCQGQDCAESIGRRMAQLLGWTPRRLDAELEAYHAHVARSHRFRK